MTMNQAQWKESYRLTRLNHNKPAARAWRISRKLLALSSPVRYAQKMATLEQAHAEIAPHLSKLAEAQQALENLSLA